MLLTEQSVDSVHWVAAANIMIIQWNLEVTKGQGTDKMYSLQWGFVISRFFFLFYY